MKSILSSKWGKMEICAGLFGLIGFLGVFLALTISNTNFIKQTAQAQGVLTCSPDYNYNPFDYEPHVQTDKMAYAFGESVFITGEGYECSIELTVMVTQPDGTQDSAIVITDDHGNFGYEYISVGVAGDYLVDVLAATTDSASTMFSISLAAPPTPASRSPGTRR